MKAKRTALVTSQVEVKDKVTKKRLHLDSSTKEVKAKYPQFPEGQQFARVKAASGVTLSMGWQSVRVDVGVELPWPVTPGTEGINELRSGFDQTYEFIDDELSARAKDIEGLLSKLAKKYQR